MKRKNESTSRATPGMVEAVMDSVFLDDVPGVPVDRPPAEQEKWDRLSPSEQLEQILAYARRADIAGTRPCHLPVGSWEGLIRAEITAARKAGK